jgi:hypothetical protein
MIERPIWLLPEELAAKVKKNIDDFEAFKKKYPDGVFYNDGGYPDFGPHVQATVKLDGFTPGNHELDMRRADQEMRKIDPNFVRPDGYTWHHHEDGTTMQMVPEDLHDAYKHTGGMAVTKHKGKQP